MSPLTQKRLHTLAFVALTLGGGLIIGYVFRAGGWYDGLNKPSFNPPGWVFAPVWSILYILIGIAGARVFRHPALSHSRVLWVTQLVLNFVWTPFFFGLHWPAVAMATVTTLTAVILGFIVATWHADRVAASLFIPYAAWSAFATVLNGAIVILNT